MVPPRVLGQTRPEAAPPERGVQGRRDGRVLGTSRRNRVSLGHVPHQGHRRIGGSRSGVRERLPVPGRPNRLHPRPRRREHPDVRPGHTRRVGPNDGGETPGDHREIGVAGNPGSVQMAHVRPAAQPGLRTQCGRVHQTAPQAGGQCRCTFRTPSGQREFIIPIPS